MRKRWILILASSLALAGCTNMQKTSTKGDEEDEGNEVKVKFDECPAPVQATLARESGNAKIETVDKEMKDGKTIYEADAMVNGQNWEIKVADDGKLLTKKLDKEEDEKKGQREERNEKSQNGNSDKDSLLGNGHSDSVEPLTEAEAEAERKNQAAASKA